jgi:hypothetical protein
VEGAICRGCVCEGDTSGDSRLWQQSPLVGISIVRKCSQYASIQEISMGDSGINEKSHWNYRVHNLGDAITIRK